MVKHFKHRHNRGKDRFSTGLSNTADIMNMQHPPPALLKALRKDIYENIEDFVAIMEKPAFKKTYPTMEGEVLKRMPAGYPSDFKYDEILRHKDFSVVSYKPDEFFFEPDWMDKAVEDFKLLYPFNQFLNYTVDEYLGRV